MWNTVHRMRLVEQIIGATKMKFQIKEECTTCAGQGVAEPFNPSETIEECRDCQGEGVQVYLDRGETVEDVREDYPNALTIKAVYR